MSGEEKNLRQGKPKERGRPKDRARPKGRGILICSLDLKPESGRIRLSCIVTIVVYLAPLLSRHICNEIM